MGMYPVSSGLSRVTKYTKVDRVRILKRLRELMDDGVPFTVACKHLDVEPPTARIWFRKLLNRRISEKSTF